MRVTLVDSSYLIPSLVSALTAADFLVAPTEEGDATLEILTPWIPNPTDAAALVAGHVNRWAALHGAEVVIDPPPPRIAHPASISDSHEHDRPTLTIGVPVYNGARHLEEALESIVSQSFGDLEIVICDNASTDDTLRIARSFARRDERVTILESPLNRGAAWNYNRALTLANGRYFKWAAHDDVLQPTYIERCVEVLDRAPASVVLVYPKTVIIDDGSRVVRRYEDGLDLRQSEPHERVATLIRNVVMSNAIFGVMRVDALRRTRGHGTFISADYVLLAELALAGQFWEIPDPLFLRREHAEMSRAALTTPEELAEWFRPGTGTPQTTEFLRLFLEYVHAVRDADLRRRERVRVYTRTVPLWLRRFRRPMWQEIRRRGIDDRTARVSETQDRPRRTVPVAVPSAPLERISVRDLVRETVARVAPDFVPDIRIHVDPTLVVEVDPAAVEIVVSNLISNAVRYGRAPVTVTATVEDEFVLTVDDAGRGVDPRFVPVLFEPFTRSEHSRSLAEGAGLGLAVSQLSAEASGGRLLYEPLEVGARFRLVYPSRITRLRDSPQRPAVRRAQRGAVGPARASGGLTGRLEALEEAA